VSEGKGLEEILRRRDLLRRLMPGNRKKTEKERGEELPLGKDLPSEFST